MIYKIKLFSCFLLLSIINRSSSSLMSRIGLRLGGKPAHLSGLDHTRKLPWAVKEMLEEERREQEELTFLRKKGHSDEERDPNEPPPCVGVCYYQKLQQLKAKEEMLEHGTVLQEVEEEADDRLEAPASIDEAVCMDGECEDKMATVDSILDETSGQNLNTEDAVTVKHDKHKGAADDEDEDEDDEDDEDDEEEHKHDDDEEEEDEQEDFHHRGSQRL